MKHIESISTEELHKNLDNPGHILVDTRPVAAYNGWQLKGDGRGGHIRGAKSLPHKWARYIDWFEIVKSKGITPDKTITVYGYNNSDSQEVAEMLLRAGYEKVQLYHGFLNDWVVNESFPMDFLKNYQQLVYPEWLSEVLSGNKPDALNGNKVVICHAHYDVMEDYHKGHIPEAIPLNTLDLESPDTWNCRSPKELKNTLENYGIDRNTTVVLYGRFSYPDNTYEFPGKNAGHLAAMRCALLMLYAGVKDVKILNGGLMAWEEAGFETTTRLFSPKPVDGFGAEIPAHPEIIVNMEEAKDMLRSPDSELVSVRSWDEFIGDVSGYNYIQKTGRIPGAVFGNCGSDAYHMENYRNLDHTMLEYHEVEANWKDQGVTPDKHIAFYCGTGWRASEAFFNAYMMGWPNISIFDGGWFEWSNKPDNPIGKGVPENAVASMDK